jgi:hypothetical protein
MWKPSNPKTLALIKLTVWSGLLTWMVFLLAYGIVAVRRLAIFGPQLFGTSAWGQVLSWVAPVWLLFTTALLIWAVARFASKKLRRSADV